MYTIYKLTNKINGKTYIGYTTKTVEQRFNAHCRSPADTHLCRAIKKYGANNFIREILCWGEDDRAGLDIAEPLLIAHFKPKYNHTAGGDGGGHSLETRLKLSKKHTGKILSFATRIKMSKAAIRCWRKRKGNTPYTPIITYMA